MSFLLEIKEGWEYIRREKLFVKLTKITMLMNIYLVSLTSLILPYLIQNILGLPIETISMSQLSMGLFGILASIFIRKKNIKLDFKLIEVTILGIALTYLGYIFVYLSSSISIILPIILSIISMGIFGISTTILGSTISYIYASNLDENYIGRLMSFRLMAAQTSSAISLLVIGKLLDNINMIYLLIIFLLSLLISYYRIKSQED